ncbi:MAG: hypothetical protein IPM38_01895 [Ignavibacteria bacterium]|nr:hypothetical protein [Ignavibacteria bacterium]
MVSIESPAAMEDMFRVNLLRGLNGIEESMSIRKLHVNYNFTCFRWMNLFEITDIYKYLYQWFEDITKTMVYNCGYVIMPNHLHLLTYTANSQIAINNIIGNGKRFLACEIVDRLEKSGRHDLLKLMSDGVNLSEKKRNKEHEVFEDSFDCKELFTEKFIKQKLNYIHRNPISGKWKLAEDYLDYEYSSARFYIHGEKAKCNLHHYANLISAGSPRKIISLC